MTLQPIYYDTETTGLKPEHDRIIEIAAFNPLSGKSYVSLINPGTKIPPEASAVSKITDSMVQDAPPFAQVMEEFLAFCGDSCIMIAHNNEAFDKQFLICEFKRLNRTMPQEWQFLDTLKWARRYRPDLPKHSLQFLREMYQITANNAHRALDDVIVLHKVFEAMIGDLSLETVVDLLSKESAASPGKVIIADTMPFGKHQNIPLKDLPSSYARWLSTSGALDKPDNLALKERLVALGKI